MENKRSFCFAFCQEQHIRILIRAASIFVLFRLT